MRRAFAAQIITLDHIEDLATPPRKPAAFRQKWWRASPPKEHRQIFRAPKTRRSEIRRQAISPWRFRQARQSAFPVFQNPLPAVKFSRPKMSGLHFVEEQKQIVFVAKFSQSDQIFRRRDRDPALALDRLDQNGRCRFCDRGAHRFEIVKRHMLESRHRRLESFLHFLLTGRGDSGQGPSMK